MKKQTPPLYIIVEARDVPTLVLKINERLKAGWELSGSMTQTVISWRERNSDYVAYTHSFKQGMILPPL